MKLHSLGTFVVLSLCLAQSAWSEPATETVKMTNCLVEQLHGVPVLAHDASFSIVEIPSNQLESLRILAQKSGCGAFMNLSQHDFKQHLKNPSDLLKEPIQTMRVNTHYSLSFPKEVNRAIQHIVSDNIWQTVSQLSSFQNRSSTQDNGANAAIWLQEKFLSLAKEHNRQDIKTFFVQTGGRYRQPSLVTVIGPHNTLPAIVIGAHMDTLGDSETIRMPGADDDASGSATAIEVARVLLATKLPLKRPIYIIWYAAEEMGLVGSQKVVSYFKSHAIPVQAVLQLDMTGYRKNENHEDKTMWLYQDYTDTSLTNFVGQLIKAYIKVPVANSLCGYGCSDHASWNAVGIPAAFPGETSFSEHNPYIHTVNDKIDPLDVEHMANFTKLGLAFAVELGMRE